jgi:hypothetical protein
VRWSANGDPPPRRRCGQGFLPQANDITAGLIELESQPAAPRAAAPTTSESVKYTMFLPFEFDASKNEVSIETA